MRHRPVSPVLSLGLLCLALGAASCDGGSGDSSGDGGGDSSGSGPRFTIRWGSAQLTAHFFHNQSFLANTYAKPVTASVTGTIDPLPSGTIYPLITVAEPVFTSASVQSSGGNSFSLYLTPDMQLPAGTYSGDINVQIFQDAAHTQSYAVTGGTLPYTLAVDEELTVTVEIDGVPVETGFSSSNTAVTTINDINNYVYWYSLPPASSFTLAPGQILSLKASVPVRWYSPDVFYPYGYLWDAPTVTDTTLTQTIPALSNAMSGNTYVAMPMTGGQWGAGFKVDTVP